MFQTIMFGFILSNLFSLQIDRKKGGQILFQAGFKLQWFTDLPEYADDAWHWNFNLPPLFVRCRQPSCKAARRRQEGARLTYHTVAPFLSKIKDEILRLKPTALLCASQGGAYLATRHHARAQGLSS